jgi:hypothetical protein
MCCDNKGHHQEGCGCGGHGNECGCGGHGHGCDCHTGYKSNPCFWTRAEKIAHLEGHAEKLQAELKAVLERIQALKAEA